ncbi:circularly permuted type 2 ATP-grasp protein [Sphingomonas lacusdianchii]|uniref:circularly permuted type 2 ATP-grasp protein n=1 Tax=Sphingomonas lacusdianchii TaxID=2917992 RepID=UPI001F593D3C|nr:circularly permuted type 2 ATP-grasp protein [Sphingomonas sp. JXJ CY 53]
MASRAINGRYDAGATGERWLTEYRTRAPQGDVLSAATDGDRSAWEVAFEELASLPGNTLAAARERAQRHADDIGTAYRAAGESEERRWPLSPVPLLIGADEWRIIADGMAERADLFESVIADIHGDQQLVADGTLPAMMVTGSPLFLRPMVGVVPPGGHQLHFVAADLCRGPDGRWRVLADHVRVPVGAGYALENRLAMARTLGGLPSRLNIERHAPFFAAMRAGIAAACRRAEPRIGLLTSGKLNPSYAEQAHLARYLGFLLVEGADLAVRDDHLYVRTIAGLKRIDALWRRIDPRLIDPLAFDAGSTIGVPGLVDAMAAGNVVIANAPGVGVLESPAFAAFLPALGERLLGRAPALPSIATWWCGRAADREHVLTSLDQLVVGPAFAGPPVAGLPDGAVLGAALDGEARERLATAMALRPQDYVGQEVAELSTMPTACGEGLQPRPFSLRVFAARGADGRWVVLPGGFVRIGDQPDARAAVMGEGSWSADVIVHGPDPVAPISLLQPADSVELRRNPGTLPSRVADNMFWLGRYLERGEALLGVIRVLFGHSISADTGAALAPETVERLVTIIADTGAAARPPSHRRRDLVDFGREAMESVEGWGSVRAINRMATGIGGVSRDRLSADMVRLLDAPHPTAGTLLDRAGTLQHRYAALAGLSAEHMGRTDAWRFHDLGRRIERAMAATRTLLAVDLRRASAEDLSTLLDLADSQISYRQRYLIGFARVPVIDLIALDPGNPRGIAFQVETIVQHLCKLPVLNDAGIAEPQQRIAARLTAAVAIGSAERLDRGWLLEINQQLQKLSDAIATRYFLQGAQALREAGLTLA